MKYLIILLLFLTLVSCGKTGLHRFNVGDCVAYMESGGEFLPKKELLRKTILKVGNYQYLTNNRYGLNSDDIFWIDTVFERCAKEEEE